MLKRSYKLPRPSNNQTTNWTAFDLSVTRFMPCQHNIKADELRSATGFNCKTPVQDDGVARNKPLSMAWITDDLIAEHRRVWSHQYQRIISDEEAVEIIMNVKRFAEVILGDEVKE